MNDAATRSSRTPVARTLILLLIAFLGGLAAMAWLLGRWPGGAQALGLVPDAPPASSRRAAETRAPAARAAPGDVPGRIAEIEERLARVDRVSREAVGNADRAEGLLVAFAARRALDRGVALGYIEGLLRDRFAGTQRLAVATIITAARRPVTLEALRAGLSELGPNLMVLGPSDDWWTATRRELGSLVTIRRAGSTSTVPTERLQRARDQLDAGQVDVALAEVLRLPGQERAAEWIAEARRYVAARRALDTIETAALLDPAREFTERPAFTPPALPPADPARSDSSATPVTTPAAPAR